MREQTMNCDILFGLIEYEVNLWQEYSQYKKCCGSYGGPRPTPRYIHSANIHPNGRFILLGTGFGCIW